MFQSLSARRRAAALLATLASAVGACSPSPENPSEGSSEGERVSGSERIGWSQVAASVSEASAYAYVVYVDGVRTVLGTASCGAGAGAAYSCSAPLPALAPGRRVLELAAVWVARGAPQEGPRSQPLVIFVDPSARSTWSLTNGGFDTPPGGSPVPPTGEPVCFDAADCYDVEAWPVALARPRALVPLPGRRALVADAGARIWEARDPGRLTPMSISPPCPEGAEVASIVLDPAFEANRFVYVAWLCENGQEQSSLLLMRYRELRGVLAEAATIFEWPSMPDGNPQIAAGGDGKLYVAIPDASSWTLLRVTADGTTPGTNPAGSPVIGRGRELTALSASPIGAVVLWEGRELTSYDEQRGAGEGQVEGFGARHLGLHAGPRQLSALAIGRVVDWQSSILVAETGRELILRLRKNRGDFGPSGSVQVPSCGIPTELAWADDGSTWSLGLVDPPGAIPAATGPAWRICRLNPTAANER